MKKLPLHFRPDGGFRILLMSDAHQRPYEDDRSIRAMDALITRTCPDLVILGGDNVGGCAEKAAFEETLTRLVQPMESRKIPWAHIFGNHDRTPVLSKAYQETVYESFPHCVSMRSPADVPGEANWFLPVCDMQDRPVFGIWGLDSHQDFTGPAAPLPGCPEGGRELLLPQRLQSRSDDDFIRWEQIAWYVRLSGEHEAKYGGRIPSLMVLHIPLPEYREILLNPVETDMRGECHEGVSSSEVNSGLFAAALQRGDVCLIFSGHDHVNTFDGVYGGIRMGYDGSIGYHGYGLKDAAAPENVHRLRGGRIFDLRITDPWHPTTEMVLVGDAV